MKPLNGTKTHPLSAKALAAIQELRDGGPKPAQEFNPGIVDRLMREGCVELVSLPSPYRTRPGKVLHLRLKSNPAHVTDAANSSALEATAK